MAEELLNASDVVAVIVADTVDVAGIYCAVAAVVVYSQHGHVQRQQHDDVEKEAGLGGRVKARDDGVLQMFLALATAKEKSRGLHRNLQNKECIYGIYQIPK